MLEFKENHFDNPVWLKFSRKAKQVHKRNKCVSSKPSEPVYTNPYHKITWDFLPKMNISFVFDPKSLSFEQRINEIHLLTQYRGKEAVFASFTIDSISLFDLSSLDQGVSTIYKGFYTYEGRFMHLKCDVQYKETSDNSEKTKAVIEYFKELGELSVDPVKKEPVSAPKDKEHSPKAIATFKEEKVKFLTKMGLLNEESTNSIDPDSLNLRQSFLHGAYEKKVEEEVVQSAKEKLEAGTLKLRNLNRKAAVALWESINNKLTVEELSERFRKKSEKEKTEIFKLSGVLENTFPGKSKKMSELEILQTLFEKNQELLKEIKLLKESSCKEEKNKILEKELETLLKHKKEFEETITLLKEDNEILRKLTSSNVLKQTYEQEALEYEKLKEKGEELNEMIKETKKSTAKVLSMYHDEKTNLAEKEKFLSIISKDLVDLKVQLSNL